MGGVVDPNAAYLLLRGMKTLQLRVDRQNATGVSVGHVCVSMCMCVRGKKMPRLRACVCAPSLHAGMEVAKGHSKAYLKMSRSSSSHYHTEDATTHAPIMHMQA